MNIRKMREKDSSSVLEMMKVFYHSPAVLVKADVKVLQKDIDDCIGDCPYIDGYIFEDNNICIGYSMVAKGYSTEYGGICIWIEDLYITESYRGKGISKTFFKFIEDTYIEAKRFRLEVEEDNISAVKAYKKNGYHFVPYQEMSKEQKK